MLVMNRAKSRSVIKYDIDENKIQKFIPIDIGIEWVHVSCVDL